VITPQQAQNIRTRNEALNKWIDTIRGKNGWASYKPEDKPANVPDVSNEERSALEVFEFVTNPPDKYFLYINEKTAQQQRGLAKNLATFSFAVEYRDNFGESESP